jgi:prevent-host-death family protein
MSNENWTVAKASAKLDELIEKARSRGQQTITGNGRSAAIVVSPEQWQRRTGRVGTLADFFAASPLRSSGLKIPRAKRAL